MLHLVVEIALTALCAGEAFWIYKLLKSSAIKPPSLAKQLQTIEHVHLAEVCSVCRLAVHRFTSLGGVIKCANCIAEGK